MKYPKLFIKGTPLQLRNIAKLLGRRENWCKRLVFSAFGEEVCDKALHLSDVELKEMKKNMIQHFQSQFTDEDFKMEEALKKAENEVYESEDDI